MNKHFALMAIIAMVGVVSCNKNPKPEPTPKPEPDPDPVTATITAGDVTVDEGKTVSINATTNSTAAITYATADAAVATVNDKGEVTGVKAGNTKITLKVAAVDKKFTAAEKTINVTVNAVEVPPTPVAGITIDGEFADWTELEDGTFTKFVNNPDSPWEGVEEIRCYATTETVYYYIKFDEESLNDCKEAAEPSMHLRVNFNVDGEYTSGYTNYFLEAYDLMIECEIMNSGNLVDLIPGEFCQRINGGWVTISAGDDNLITGKGAGVEYELSVSRAAFDQGIKDCGDIPAESKYYMGDEFQTSLRFYWNGWDEFSNMPNCSLEEEQGNGWGFLMRIKTNK